MNLLFVYNVEILLKNVYAYAPFAVNEINVNVLYLMQRLVDEFV